MNTISVTDASSALHHVAKVPLPAPALSRFDFEATDTKLPRPPAYETGVDQTVTVGSQIAEFAAGVPAEPRPLIANSFLLAQLAANRAIKDKGGGTSQWYACYIDTLANTGWLVESESLVQRGVSSKSGQLHKEIIPILTLALGPAAAASALVLGVLEGSRTWMRASRGSRCSTTRASAPRPTSSRSATPRHPSLARRRASIWPASSSTRRARSPGSCSSASRIPTPVCAISGPSSA